MRWANPCKIAATLLLLMISGGMAVSAAATRDRATPIMEETAPAFLSGKNTVADLLAHSALKDFAVHMLPRTEDAQGNGNMRLDAVATLMPWHSHVRPEVVLSGINRLISDAASGKPVFYSFSDDAAVRDQTGLFFFRGKPGAPFALICPGGGFRYVGSLHEGYPIADIISRHGFNAFVLQYRTGGESVACADMAHALSWIFANASTLEISVNGYSVWGGSAGARMAADLGAYGARRLGGADVPKPSAVIMAYTGHDWMTPQDPPTFSVVSMDDPIADYRIMQARTKALKDADIDAEILLVRHAGHGFGVGHGTDAEGWVEAALRFWERQLSQFRD